MWTLVAMNGIAAVLLFALLGALFALTHRWLGPAESGRNDGGIGQQPPRPQVPRGPFDRVDVRTHTLPERQESHLGLSA